MRYLIERRYIDKDGNVKIYRYWNPKKKYFIAGEWKKCPFNGQELPADQVKAYTRAEELNAALDAWRSGEEAKQPLVEESFDWLICEYKKSSWFKKASPRTQKEYGYILEAIREHLRARCISNAPAKEFNRQHARMLHHAFSAKPRKAQMVITLARLVFNYGEETGILAPNSNPFTKMRLRRNAPRQQLWLDIDTPNNMFWRIIALKKAAIDKGWPAMAFAIDLALFSMQREGDIIGLVWNKYDGAAITLKQGKTKKWVSVPVTPLPVFKQILDTARRVSPLMLINDVTEKPFTRFQFSQMFGEIREAAGQPAELQYRDFRRTGMVLRGMAGAQPQEIAAGSGHSIEETTQILETYIPRNAIMAQHGAAKLQEKYGEELKKILTGCENAVEKKL